MTNKLHKAEDVREKNKKKTRTYLVFSGATGRIRTGDLLITNQLLYRLSHSSNKLLNKYITLIEKKQAI